MSKSAKNTKKRETEANLAKLVEKLATAGVTVRREHLSRGRSFRVRSGECSFSGEKHVFIDRRLPEEHQVSLFVDYFKKFKISVDEEFLSQFPSKTRLLFSSLS